MLTSALRHRIIVLTATVILFAGSIYLIPRMGFEFMPTQDMPVP